MENARQDHPTRTPPLIALLRRGVRRFAPWELYVTEVHVRSEDFNGFPLGLRYPSKVGRLVRAKACVVVIILIANSLIEGNRILPNFHRLFERLFQLALHLIAKDESGFRGCMLERSDIIP